MSDGGGRTAAYAALRARVLDGSAPAGSWLRESAVAAELGVSRTPVREALQALAAEGLVELVRHRGARVVGWTAEDVDEVYRLRALLEGYGARLAARSATPEQVSGLRALEDAYEAALGTEQAAPCNDAFHAAVLEAGGSPRLPALLGLVSSGGLVAQAYRHYGPDDLRRSVVQHRDVVEAVARGDEETAEAAMRAHLLAARWSASAVSGA